MIVKVMVQDPPPKDQDKEAKRRASLMRLGCEVVPVESLVFTGLLVDYPGIDSMAIISSENGAVGQDFDYTHEQVRLYHADEDLPVIRNLGDALATQVGSAATKRKNKSNLRIMSLQLADLYSGLRRVPQYANSTFSIEEVPLDKRLRVSQTHIKEYKLLQIETLIQELESGGFDLFAPCQYELQDGSFSVITPPVLEMTPNGPVIIEGHTRAFYMAQLRRARFRGVIVSNVRDPLPATPRSFSELRVADSTMTATSIIPNYERRFWRPIEEVLHP